MNKKRELETGHAYVCISHDHELTIKEKVKLKTKDIKEWPRRAFHIVSFLVVKEGVKIFEKTKEIVYPKISHIVDAVKGRDIPKNRGSVSLFLKHIEDYKEVK